MAADSYSFLDIAALPGVRGRFARGDALLLLSVGLDEVLWANGPGAALFGFDSIDSALDAPVPIGGTARRQIAATKGFPQIGTDRSVAVRLVSGMGSRVVPFKASALALPDDATGILLSVPVAKGSGAEQALAGIAQPGQAAAMIDGEGNTVAASAEFPGFSLSPDLLRRLVAKASDGAEGPLKQRVKAGGRILPVGVARLEDGLNLVIVTEDDFFDLPDDILSADEAGESEVDPGEAVTFVGVREAAEDGGGVDILLDGDASDGWYFAEGQPAEEQPETPAERLAVLQGADPVRFSWRTDADGRFVSVSPEFATLAGHGPGALAGRHFGEMAARLGAGGEEIAELLKGRDTWSGRTVLWPMADGTVQVPVDLAALPTYSRARNFEGFRGFGVARTGDATLAPPEVPVSDDDAAGPEAGRPAAAQPDPPASPPEPTLREDSDKVVQLLSAARAVPAETALSPGERDAFLEIGARLKEGEADQREAGSTTVPAPEAPTAQEADPTAVPETDAAAEEHVPLPAQAFGNAVEPWKAGEEAADIADRPAALADMAEAAHSGPAAGEPDTASEREPVPAWGQAIAPPIASQPEAALPLLDPRVEAAGDGTGERVALPASPAADGVTQEPLVSDAGEREFLEEAGETRASQPMPAQAGLPAEAGNEEPATTAAGRASDEGMPERPDAAPQPPASTPTEEDGLRPETDADRLASSAGAGLIASDVEPARDAGQDRFFAVPEAAAPPSNGEIEPAVPPAASDGASTGAGAGGEASVTQRERIAFLPDEAPLPQREESDGDQLAATADGGSHPAEDAPTGRTSFAYAAGPEGNQAADAAWTDASPPETHEGTEAAPAATDGLSPAETDGLAEGGEADAAAQPAGRLANEALQPPATLLDARSASDGAGWTSDAADTPLGEAAPPSAADTGEPHPSLAEDVDADRLPAPAEEEFLSAEARDGSASSEPVGAVADDQAATPAAADGAVPDLDAPAEADGRELGTESLLPAEASRRFATSDGENTPPQDEGTRSDRWNDGESDAGTGSSAEPSDQAGQQPVTLSPVGNTVGESGWTAEAADPVPADAARIARSEEAAAHGTAWDDASERGVPPDVREETDEAVSAATEPLPSEIPAEDVPPAATFGEEAADRTDSLGLEAGPLQDAAARPQAAVPDAAEGLDGVDRAVEADAAPDEVQPSITPDEVQPSATAEEGEQPAILPEETAAARLAATSDEEFLAGTGPTGPIHSGSAEAGAEEGQNAGGAAIEGVQPETGPAAAGSEERPEGAGDDLPPARASEEEGADQPAIAAREDAGFPNIEAPRPPAVSPDWEQSADESRPAAAEAAGSTLAGAAPGPIEEQTSAEAVGAAEAASDAHAESDVAPPVGDQAGEAVPAAQAPVEPPQGEPATAEAVEGERSETGTASTDDAASDPADGAVTTEAPANDGADFISPAVPEPGNGPAGPSEGFDAASSDETVLDATNAPSESTTSVESLTGMAPESGRSLENDVPATADAAENAGLPAATEVAPDGPAPDRPEEAGNLHAAKIEESVPPMAAETSALAGVPQAEMETGFTSERENERSEEKVVAADGGDVAAGEEAFPQAEAPGLAEIEPSTREWAAAASLGLAAGLPPVDMPAGDEPEKLARLRPAAPDTSILDRLPIPVLIHSGDLLHYANPDFLTLADYPSLAAFAEAGGLGCLFTAPWERISEGADRHLRLRTGGGEEFPVEALLRSVPWRGNKALLLVLRRLEGTPPREAEDAADLGQRLTEMRAIVDTATDGVVLIAPDGTIRSISRPAEALFGLDSAQAAGRPFGALFAVESQRTVTDYVEGLAGDGVASVMNDGREVIGREAKGGFIPLFMTIGTLPEGSGFCAVLRDITQWKRAEEELTQSRALAERASSHKTDFLARVSHEIRTPLNAIIGFSELMLDEKFGPVGSDRYRDYLRDINRSGNHVLDLVNDLLDISKIEAGQQEMSYEAVALNDALAEAVATMQPQANRERVIIRASLASRLPDVVADPRSVRQIALNVLANAIRFTQAGGQVIVSTAYDSSGDVVMRVRDTGIGMSQAEIEQALKPFKQINSLKRSRGDGTGLGLPLTKAMVEANRARFAISSDPGIGTMVEVTFPATRVLAG